MLPHVGTRRRKAEPVVDQYSAEDLQNAGRIKQIRMVAKLVNEQNKRALPITFGAAAGVIVVFVLLGLFVGPLALFLPIGILLGLMAAMILFGRFAQKAQYSAIDGQLGAAAAVLQNMRGDWTVTPAVAGNRTMDVVHRAVGRPGVVLVGEGVPTRVAGLLSAERKKTEREQPKLGPVKAFIDRILNEDQQAPRKQRHTAHRIWTRLREEQADHPIGEPTVRQYVRERKRQMGITGREIFVPQSYGLGQEGQVDWFEAVTRLDGQLCTLQFFAMRSMASGGDKTRAFPTPSLKVLRPQRQSSLPMNVSWACVLLISGPDRPRWWCSSRARSLTRRGFPSVAITSFAA